MHAVDDVAAILISIVVLAGITFALSSKANTPRVFGKFWKGFGNAVGAARGN